MKGLRHIKNYPEVPRGILAAIIEELLAISPIIRVVPISANDGRLIKVGYDSAVPGIRFKYERSFTLDVTIDDHKVVCVDDVRTGRTSGGGWWTGDIRDEAELVRVIEYCKNALSVHIEDFNKHPFRKRRKLG